MLIISEINSAQFSVGMFWNGGNVRFSVAPFGLRLGATIHKMFISENEKCFYRLGRERHGLLFPYGWAVLDFDLGGAH